MEDPPVEVESLVQQMVPGVREAEVAVVRTLLAAVEAMLAAAFRRAVRTGERAVIDVRGCVA